MIDICVDQSYISKVPLLACCSWGFDPVQQELTSDNLSLRRGLIPLLSKTKSYLEAPTKLTMQIELPNSLNNILDLSADHA